MQALSDKLTVIEEKIKLLARKLQQVETENAGLKEENRKLRTDLSVTHGKGIQITPPVAIAPKTKEKNAKEPMSSTKLKKEIDQYIKEIDKCIVWLEKS